MRALSQSITILLVACGGPPRFAQSGTFSATGTCGADMSDLPPESGDDGYGHQFYGVGVLITLDDGHLTRVQYELSATTTGERLFSKAAVVAGRWQEVKVPVTEDSTRERSDFSERRLRILPDGPAGSVQVAFVVTGDKMQIRLNQGKPVNAECVWE
jgi:hypothetical protein